MKLFKPTNYFDYRGKIKTPDSAAFEVPDDLARQFLILGLGYPIDAPVPEPEPVAETVAAPGPTPEPVTEPESPAQAPAPAAGKRGRPRKA